MSLYVDDLLVTRSDEGFVKQFKLNIEKEFEMFDLDKMSIFWEWKFIKMMLGFSFFKENMPEGSKGIQCGDV